MDISVIIATFNRASILRGTLERLAALRPAGISHEIIIVDNNSGDETRAVVDSFAGQAPIRYLFEPVQGKNRALNRAVSAGQGELFLFTDDDVFVPADWLDRYWAAARAYPHATYFGGSIRALLPSTAPAWARTCGFDLVDHALGECDRRADRTVDEIAGPNMAVRRRVFDAGLRFNALTGPVGVGGRRASEASLLSQLDARGDVGWIVAGEAVVHRVDVQPWMLSRGHQFRRRFNYARGLVRAGEYPVGSRRVLGVRVGPWYALAQAGVGFVASRAPGRGIEARVRAERTVATRLGALVELGAVAIERAKPAGVAGNPERVSEGWPAVVVAGAFTTGVVLMRNLSRRGVVACCVDRNRELPGFRTRYGRGYECPDPDLHPGAWVAYMQDLSRRLGGRPVLMASADIFVSAIAEHAAVLRKCFIFSEESIQVQARLATKRRQYDLAAESGMPVPRSAVIGSAQELAAFARDARFPCVLKPLHYRHWQRVPRDHQVRGKKVLVAQSATELASLYRIACEGGSEMVVQEMIHGPDTAKLVYLSCYGSGGRRLGSCLVRELRSTPIDIGSASVVEPVVDAEAEALCDAFLRRVGYVGLCEIELKRDSRDGGLRMIEANPRYSITSDAAPYAGVDLGWLHYLDLIGQHVTEVRPSGRIFRHVVLERDVQCLASYRRAGLLSFRQLLRSYRPPVYFFDLDVRDVRVAAGNLAGLARQVTSKAWRRLFSSRHQVKRAVAAPEAAVPAEPAITPHVER